MNKILFLPLFSLTLLGCYKGEEADLIIHNATIYTCNESFAVEEAMAIKDGKILQVGPEREIRNAYQAEKEIDMMQQAVYPGFHDAHCHFKGYAQTLNQVDLVGCESFHEMVNRIVEFDKENDFKWITGRGWDHTLWGQENFPTNDTLNKLFPNTPIAVRRVGGHAALVNQKALDIAGFDINTKINGGEIVQKNGKLTGILLDNAFDTLAKHIPALTKEELLPLMQQAEQNLFEVGLTSINDAGIEAHDRQMFIQWYKTGDLKIKDYCMLFPDDDNLDFSMEEGDFREENLHIRSFKVIADGALGSWSACMLDPYEDNPHQHGFLLRNFDEFQEIADYAAEIGYQVNTHAIGDSANRTTLKIYKNAVGNKADHRWKIEHAQVLSESDFDYFEQYNIIPSVQPTHCTSDMRWAEKRLGPERVKNAYAYQELLEKAGLIALGTDFPVEGIDPLKTFYAAVGRMDKNGKPTGGFQMENAISRTAALKGMTIWAAYSNFENHEKGSLEAGKAADFVVLDQDIMKVPVKKILKTYVVMTYLNGEEVYSAE